MLVMVADDDPTTCAVVATILQRAGHSTVLARDAMQVLRLARLRTPDVIVLDIMTPAGTGLGALEKLKENVLTQMTPVVVLSGVTDEATVARVRELGAAEFLHKPVDPDALLAALARVKPGT